MLIARHLRRFRRDGRGLAAVEFALILPVMITLFFGIVELSLALAARADVVSMTSIAADLVAQESSVTPTGMTNVFAAASAVLYPYATAPLTVTIYSIVDDGHQGKAGMVRWSCTRTGDGTATNGPNTPPAGSNGGELIATANPDSHGNPQYGSPGSVILAQVSYNYTSPTTQVITGPIAMGSSFYSKPRRVAEIPAPTSCS